MQDVAAINELIVLTWDIDEISTIWSTNQCFVNVKRGINGADMELLIQLGDRNWVRMKRGTVVDSPMGNELTKMG